MSEREPPTRQLESCLNVCVDRTCSISSPWERDTDAVHVIIARLSRCLLTISICLSPPPLPTLGLVLILPSFICRLEHNTAGGLGGALYYDSCSKLDKTCFVQGVEPLSGSRAILLRHNRARAGGAVYVECSDMGSICTETFSKNNTIGALPQLPKVEFTGSQASFYGNALATQPASMRLHEKVSCGVEIVPSRTSQCTPQSARSPAARSPVPKSQPSLPFPRLLRRRRKGS